jgi:hypothetical protein
MCKSASIIFLPKLPRSHLEYALSDFLIDGNVFASSDESLQSELARTHKAKGRPLCMCRQPGVAMYIAKMTDLYVIKRMPDTGIEHSPHCESYEPPPELSGLGEVIGQAIKEDLESGVIALKLDFSLTKRPGLSQPDASGSPSDTVATDGKKLTLRSVLHYLWDESEMTKWSPKMLGRRSWFVVQKYVSEAALGKSAKGAELAGSLYIPEPFYPDRKDEISHRRNARFIDLQHLEKGAKKLMILVGEVKEITAARYGFKLVVKHAPDCHFMLDEDIHKRLLKRFSGELELCTAVDGSHLMAIATFGVSTAGVASIEEIALMATTENWIPFENIREKELIDALTDRSRHFVKSMRYNMAPNRALATAVLTDTQPSPVALYIDDGAEQELSAALADLISSSAVASWTWNAGAESLPALPNSARSAAFAEAQKTLTERSERPT